MIAELVSIFERDDPKSVKSIDQARAVDRPLFAAIGEKFLATAPVDHVYEFKNEAEVNECPRTPAIFPITPNQRIVT